MPKKKWKKPELIVLIRCKPEEDVLAACKAGPANPDGPMGGNCWDDLFGCSSISPS